MQCILISSWVMLLQGYMTSDIQAFSANGPPIAVSYVPDNSGPTLLLNVTIAYPGSAPQSSQVRRLLSDCPSRSFTNRLATRAPCTHACIAGIGG